jgi:hypothetical protein
MRGLRKEEKFNRRREEEEILQNTLLIFSQKHAAQARPKSS